MCKLETPAAGPGRLIVGIGSYLSRDDEIGLALVGALSREPTWTVWCVLLDSADIATVASSLLEWDKSVVLVDAANMGLAPGEFRFFPERDAALFMKDDSVSTHGFGLAGRLAAGEKPGIRSTGLHFCRSAVRFISPAGAYPGNGGAVPGPALLAEGSVRECGRRLMSGSACHMSPFNGLVIS